jgi:hypothetical protein
MLNDAEEPMRVVGWNSVILRPAINDNAAKAARTSMAPRAERARLMRLLLRLVTMS